jgi:uncharacterized membrane protein
MDRTADAAPDDLADDADSRDNVVYRQVIAVLALIAGLVALYLALVKRGVFGIPACGPGGGCTLAWFGPYGNFLGVDVALIGAVGYGVLTALAILGTFDRFAGDRRLSAVILGGVVAAVLFTWRLKYGEWWVLRTFCIWCAESFVTIHACLVLAWLDWRRVRRG